MDVIDKKILALLDINSRIASSDIAKKLKVSRQVVDYRIAQLQKKGIIQSLVTIIDPMMFYSYMWHVYLKLQNLTEKDEKELTKYLIDKNEVWWVVNGSGEWDIIFSVIGNDIVEFDQLLVEFGSKFHKFISQQQVTSFIKAIRFPRGYFTSKPTKKEVYTHKKKDLKIDNKDIAILKALVTNARLPATAIAQKTELTARQVIYRIKELMKKNVISGFRLHPNLPKLKYDYYKVCFYTQDFTESSENSIISWCEKNPYTLYYTKKIAPWTFEIEFETPDFKKLNEVLKEMRNKFGNVIKRTEITLMTEEFKGELVPL